MDNNLTALDWFIKKMSKKHKGFATYVSANSDIVRAARVLNKQQLVGAYNQDLYGGLSGHKKFDNGDDYFNQTFTLEEEIWDGYILSFTKKMLTCFLNKDGQLSKILDINRKYLSEEQNKMVSKGLVMQYDMNNDIIKFMTVEGKFI